ncbi:phosphotriesterase [Agrococcus beijingensis]|uniref:phosphotriesterase family protein n=1 Tax=Agrococcus beijingensis TaxID=3068634 RepID=UPI00274159DF|nr:phosphotriesterase [Agrococcus sp. REN33]
MTGTVHTVLGPVPADQLGVASVHESLLSVFPGAQYAHDVTIDRAEIFATLAAKLRDFREAGGGTVVDSTGMFHGRDLTLYEALSRSTGVHIVVSTGQGPEAMLGGYFLTPQTNPPTPWPAERFAELFSLEVTEGAVVPRLERRAPAGLVATAATRTGATATDGSLLRGAARTAIATGVPVSLRYGADALGELEVVLAEGLPADRVVVAGLDRADAVGAAAHLAVAERGAYVGIDSVGLEDDERIADADRVRLVAELVEAGHADRILLSTGAIGVAKGHDAAEAAAAEAISLSRILTDFVPLLAAAGIDADVTRRILTANPSALLAVRS